LRQSQLDPALLEIPACALAVTGITVAISVTIAEVPLCRADSHLG
jgi:hypothetical protein